MNGMWGYKITDQNYKSTKTLIHYLVKAAGKNANLLMNIGPQPDGELPAVAVQRLAEMGEWMKQYGETIYGTRSILTRQIAFENLNIFSIKRRLMMIVTHQAVRLEFVNQSILLR